MIPIANFLKPTHYMTEAIDQDRSVELVMCEDGGRGIRIIVPTLGGVKAEMHLSKECYEALCILILNDLRGDQDYYFVQFKEAP